MPSPQTAYVQRRPRPDLGNPRARTTQNTPTKELRPRNVSAKLDLGKGPEPVNIKKTRERVMNWQSDNSEALSPTEAGAPSDDYVTLSEDSEEHLPRRGRSRTYTQLFAANRVGNGTGFRTFDKTSPARFPFNHDSMDADVRAASKPKRRLVSDGHWKKARDAPQEPRSEAEPEPESAPPSPPPQPPPQHIFNPPRNSSVPPVKFQSGRMEVEYNVISRSPEKARLDAWTRSKPRPVEEPKPPEKKVNVGWVRPKDGSPVKEWKVHNFTNSEPQASNFYTAHRATQSVEKLRSAFTEPTPLNSPKSTGALKPRAKSMSPDKHRGAQFVKTSVEVHKPPLELTKSVEDLKAKSKADKTPVYDSDGSPFVEIHRPSNKPKHTPGSPVMEKVQKFNSNSSPPRKANDDRGKVAVEVIKNNRAAFEYFAGRMPSPEKKPEPRKPKVEPKRPEPSPQITRETAFDWIVGRDVRARADAARKHLDRRKDEPSKGPMLQPDNTAAIANLPGGTRIASWLGDMPDPFVEDAKKLRKGVAAPPSDVKEDAELSDKAERRREREARDAQHERRRRRKQEENLERAVELASPAEASPVQSQVSLTDDSNASPTTPTLKRRGAKRDAHSPRRKPAKPESPIIESDSRTDFSMPGGSVAPDDSISLRDWSQPVSKGLKSLFHRAGSRAPDLSPGENMRIARQDAALLPTIGENKPTKALVLPDQSHDHEPQRPAIKRNLASHDDLISVLSMQPEKGRGLRSACSVRSARSKAGTGSISEILSDIKADETRYLQELQTLIDGVIPVLLKSVLSSSNTAAVAGLLGPRFNASNSTTPIVNIGVALEGLRAIHRQLPLENADYLFSWARKAHRVYSDYIASWRMGFQEVVISLAPADMGPHSTSKGLPLNSEGFVTDSQGQKVDVAFLLKRPLVRLRYLAKAFRGIAQTRDSDVAREWADKYHDLISYAKKRQSEERARLEDEAAASIDVTRCRDPSTLAPLTGVSIGPDLSVRARDLFNLQLNHSTGQRMDCRIELIIRDNHVSREASGDILICEVDHSARWLLLPPFQLSRVSARRGTEKGELVVMIRGSGTTTFAWHEVLLLKPDDENTCTEWLQMLGSNPVPGPIPQVRPSLPLKNQSSSHSSDLGSWSMVEPSEVDVPMGEQASVVSRQWRSRPSTREGDEQSRLDRSPGGKKQPRPMTMPPPLHQDRGSATSPVSIDRRERLNNPDLSSNHGLTGAGSHHSLPSRPKTDRHSYHASTTASLPVDDTQGSPGKRKWLPDWAKRKLGASPSDLSSNDARASEDHHSRQRPSMDRRVSSVPSEDLPTIPKARPTYSDYGRSNMLRRKEVPAPVPRSPEGRRTEQALQGASSPMSPSPTTPQHGPSTPPHRSPAQLGSTPVSNHSPPTFTPPSSGPRVHRRSSSPLKHEYAPSDSPSDQSVDANIMSDDDADEMSSVSSADDIVPSLPPVSAFNRGSKPPHSVYMPKNAGTIAPSQSASQAAYRTVPPDTPGGGTKQIASIFCWSNKGTWEQLHGFECSIIVSPGLIEAYEMSAAHSGQRPEGINPLVGLELTPLVPLRRGTAIDISIRSPPTAVSQLKPSTNNIMFRSRNNMECEHLYNMINQARINNPTYMALQNARPPVSNWGAYMDAQANEKPSWWRVGRNRSSYRAGSSRRTPSVAGQTESSVASMSSAISALKRFSSGSRVFNVAKSTILPRDASRSISTFSSSEDGPSGASTPPAGVGRGLALDPSQGTPLGISGAKVRLYAREGAGRWRDMGAARLTIMHPPRPPGAPPPMAPDGTLKMEKRVLIVGKTRGETLLDVTLGETSFERVARTGIAVSVWEQAEVAKRGSVMTGRVKVFMIQMKGEAETAYTFSLVGRLRY